MDIRCATIGILAVAVGLVQGSCASEDRDDSFAASTTQVRYRDGITKVEFAQVTEEFLSGDDRAVWLGRAFHPLDFRLGAEPVVVLSHQLWNQLGERPAIIGETVRVDGRDRTVIGVASPGTEWPARIGVWIAQSLE